MKIVCVFFSYLAVFLIGNYTGQRHMHKRIVALMFEWLLSIGFTQDQISEMIQKRRGK